LAQLKEDCLSSKSVKKFIQAVGTLTIGRDWSTQEKYLAQRRTIYAVGSFFGVEYPLVPKKASWSGKGGVEV